MAPRDHVIRYLVPALERGLRLLELLNGDRTQISSAEAARELQLPRASVFRIVKTLEFMGYVKLVDGATYALGPAALRLGFSSAGESETPAEFPDSPFAGARIGERADHVGQRFLASGPGGE